MSSISNEKMLGGIGSILVLFTAVPNAGRIVGKAGFVMIPAANRNISQAVNDELMGARIKA